MNNEELKAWNMALESWERIIQETGFQDRKTAYLQGFYAGHKTSPKSITEEEFRSLYKDLCRDAYSSKSAGDMWEADKYRSWYEKIFKK